MRISPIVDLSLIGTTTTPSAGLTNGIIIDLDGRKVLTNRPPMVVGFDISNQGIAGTVTGRGAFYWALNNTMYFVAGGTVYRTTSSGATSVGNLTANAKERVYIAQCDTKLILIDPQNNDGWTITTGHVLTKITDVDFPSTLAHGLVVLNGSAYVLDDNGNIYGSAINDPTSWSALNFINAERSPDGGVFIAGISDHIVVAGQNSIEVFYDAGNASGSPLNRREDFALKYGVATTAAFSFATSGDLLFFVSQNGQGGFGVFMMEGISLPRKISNDAIDLFLSNTQLPYDTIYYFMGSVFNESGHIYYCLTLLTIASTTAWTPSFTTSFVFDLKTGLWSQWNTNIAGLSNTFPVVSYVNETVPVMPWTGSPSAYYYSGYGMAINGDIISIGQTGNGYLSDTILVPGAATTTYTFTVQMDSGMMDHGTPNLKFCSTARVSGQRPFFATNNYSISYANEGAYSYSTARTLNPQYPKRKLSRMGSFNRRNWRLSWVTGGDNLYVDGLDIELTAGTT